MARNPKPLRRRTKSINRRWAKFHALMRRELRGCRHAVIVEDRRDEDGSIWGRCVGCGDNGFPIRDVGYEEWMASKDRPRCGLEVQD